MVVAHRQSGGTSCVLQVQVFLMIKARVAVLTAALIVSCHSLL
jgi:hypothetical protein